jgi:hypothetical protein
MKKLVLAALAVLALTSSKLVFAQSVDKHGITAGSTAALGDAGINELLVYGSCVIDGGLQVLNDDIVTDFAVRAGSGFRGASFTGSSVCLGSAPGFSDGYCASWNPFASTPGGTGAWQFAEHVRVLGSTAVVGGAEIQGETKLGSLDAGQLYATEFRMDRCDSSGTPGSATCNKYAFRFGIANGTTQVTITNNKISSTSGVLCSITTPGGACVFPVPTVTSGQVVITCNGSSIGTSVGYCEVRN